MFFFRFVGVKLQDYEVLTSGRLEYGEAACFMLHWLSFKN